MPRTVKFNVDVARIVPRFYVTSPRKVNTVFSSFLEAFPRFDAQTILDSQRSTFAFVPDWSTTSPTSRFAAEYAIRISPSLVAADDINPASVLVPPLSGKIYSSKVAFYARAIIRRK